jgi:ketosteroid isomerase-like protein
MIASLFLALVLAQAGANAQGRLTVALPDDEFVRDLHDKKIDELLALYTPDAVFVNPDGKRIPRAGLRRLYDQVTAALDSDLHLTTVRIRRHGNTAVETGTYTETLGHRDTGQIENVHGAYLFALRRAADGRWRYARMEWH